MIANPSLPFPSRRYLDKFQSEFSKKKHSSTNYAEHFKQKLSKTFKSLLQVELPEKSILNHQKEDIQKAMSTEFEYSLVHKSTLQSDCNHENDIKTLLHINAETIVSCGNDFKVKISNVDSGKNIAIFECKSSPS